MLPVNSIKSYIKLFNLGYGFSAVKIFRPKLLVKFRGMFDKGVT